jgi:hypothetical protein
MRAPTRLPTSPFIPSAFFFSTALICAAVRSPIGRLILETLLVDSSDPIRLSDVLDGAGDRLFREAYKLGLDGIVSKR